MRYVGVVICVKPSLRGAFIQPTWATDKKDNLFVSFEEANAFLKEGMRVSFAIGKDKKGRYCATNVEIYQKGMNISTHKPDCLTDTDKFRYLAKAVKKAEIKHKAESFMEELGKEENE